MTVRQYYLVHRFFLLRMVKINRSENHSEQLDFWTFPYLLVDCDLSFVEVDVKTFQHGVQCKVLGLFPMLQRKNGIFINLYGMVQKFGVSLETSQ